MLSPVTRMGRRTNLKRISVTKTTNRMRTTVHAGFFPKMNRSHKGVWAFSGVASVSISERNSQHAPGKKRANRLWEEKREPLGTERHTRLSRVELSTDKAKIFRGAHGIALDRRPSLP